MRTKSAPDDNILDWTVSDTPFAEEAVEVFDSAVPLEAAPANLRAAFNFKLFFSRHAAFTLAGASLAVLLFVAAYTAWQSYQLRQTLTPLVLTEDEARLSGDLDKLREFMDGVDAAWKYDQSASGQFYPAALAWPLPEVGTVQAVTRFGPELVRVDVNRPYSNQPEQGYFGQVATQREVAYTFTQTQFYRWVEKDKTWKHTRPPDDFFGEQRTITSGRIEWKFPAVDRDVIEAVRPSVERTLEKACGLWACPAELGLTVTFITRTLPSGWYANLPFTQDSLLLNFYQNDGGVVYGTNTLITHSPHLLGVPADSQTYKLFERSLTLRVLANTLHRLNTMRSERRNILWMALAARLTTRFEFENPNYRAVIAPEPLFTPEELWNLRTQRIAGQYTVQLRDAQILLNRLLANLPPEAEQQLFAALPAAQNHVDWLVKALKISVEEAEGYWQAALAPISVAPATNTPNKYALFCPNTTGLSLWDGTDNTPYAALPESVLGGTPVSWSPDGQRLLLRVGYMGEQMGVVDFAARQVWWLPESGGWPMAQWLSNTRLAYAANAATPFNSYNPGSGRLVMFDTELPNQPLLELAPVNYFNVSPDHSELVVVSNDNDSIGIISQVDYKVRWLARGTNPMWVAENRQLAFTFTHNNQSVLNLLDTHTGEIRELLNAQNLLPLLQDKEGLVQNIYALTVEDGDLYVAAYVGASTSFSPDIWLGRIKLDGSDLQSLYFGENSWANFYGFLEDRNYILIMAQSYEENQSTLLVVETNTGEIIRAIQGYNIWYGYEPNLTEPLFVDQQGRLFRLRDPYDELEPFVLNPVTQMCGGLLPNPALSGP